MISKSAPQTPRLLPENTPVFAKKAAAIAHAKAKPGTRHPFNAAAKHVRGEVHWASLGNMMIARCTTWAKSWRILETETITEPIPTG